MKDFVYGKLSAVWQVFKHFDLVKESHICS